MRILRTAKALKTALAPLRSKTCRIGFVPTMGALHQGHLDLVRRARRENDRTVVSIFVNPLQFGPREDYKKYPRSLAHDVRILKSAGVDFLFIPSAGQFYPAGFQTQVRVGVMTQRLCGLSRPTHFAGVATVVMKLLNCVMPDRLYMGQKDYQQYRVIERMVADMDMPVKVICVKTRREADGLAMSSRNRYLDKTERLRAPALFRTMKFVEGLIRRGARSVRPLRAEALRRLRAEGIHRVDYFEIVDSAALSPVVKLSKGQTVLLASAVYLGRTRLIDNRLIKV